MENLIIDKNGVKDGPGGWLINKSEYVENGVPMLRGLNVLDGRVDLKNVVYITEEKNRQLSASEALPGDILITMRGTFGRAAILPDSITKANMNAALCRIRLKCPELSDYLMWYLNSQIAYKQFKRHGTKAVQDDLNLGYIKALRVILPYERSRNDILGRLLNAQKTSMQKFQQADELLDDFEKTVAARCGIRPESKSKLCCAIKFKNLDGVIDAKRYMALKGRVNSNSNSTIADVCEIVDEKMNVSLYGEQVIDWIRIDDLPNQPLDIETIRTQSAKEVEGTFFKVQKGDILVARLGPTILNQKIVIVRNVERETIASAEFLVLRCKKGYNAEAVMAILKTSCFRDLMYSHARGSTPSRYRLNREDMLKLPFPDIREYQEKLALEADELREKVKTMRVQAEQDWQAAKAQFEKELLS